MIIQNKIYSSFGPISLAGKLLLVCGFSIIWFTPYAVFLILGGAFFGFTILCTTIDVDRRKVRSGDVLFGIFRTGYWVSVNPEMSLGIQKSHRVWKTYSWSNHEWITEENNYLIFLFKPNGKKLLPLCKVENLELAKGEMFRFGDLLNLRNIQS